MHWNHQGKGIEVKEKERVALGKTGPQGGSYQMKEHQI
jgi:hypothetical protein